MMKEYDLNYWLNHPESVEAKIKEFLEKKILICQPIDLGEIQGHFLKAEHNLRFISENIKIGFLDWATSGCYYACYHAALGLILTKGYSSKNHLATLLILIRDFYKDLTPEEIEIWSKIMDYQDILFYVEAKNRREDATYTSRIGFEKKEVEQLKLKASLFVAKAKEIVYK